MPDFQRLTKVIVKHGLEMTSNARSGVNAAGIPTMAMVYPDRTQAWPNDLAGNGKKNAQTEMLSHVACYSRGLHLERSAIVAVNNFADSYFTSKHFRKSEGIKG